ncbi:MAG: hypothetical protein WBA46_14900 [Thermomicrobiales bacterium]
MHDLSSLRRLVGNRLPDRSVRGIVRAFPATIALTTIISTTSLATRNFSDERYERLLTQIGMSYADVWTRDAWHLFTVTFIQSEPGMGPGMLALLLSGLGLAELQLGAGRTVTTFFVCDWICTIVTSILLGALQHLDFAPIVEAFHEFDAGSSAAGVATLSAGLFLLFPNRLARIALAVVLLWNVVSFDFLEPGPATVHTVAVFVGVIFAQVVWKRGTFGRVVPSPLPGHGFTDAHA